MAYVQIPKDLKRVKTKVAFNLTKRQLIGFLVAGVVGLGTFFLVRNVLPNQLSIFALVLAAFPIFFVTMYEKDGMHFEEMFRHLYNHKYHQPHERVRKEVYLEQAKKGTREKAQKTKGTVQKK